MSRPGTDVELSDTLPAASAPTDTGVAFLIGEAAQGPVDAPAQIKSPDSFTATFGEPINPPHLHDAVEAAFRDGVGTCYVLRLADATAAASTIDVMNTAGDATLYTVTAANPGTWGDDLTLDLVDAAALRELTSRKRHLALAPDSSSSKRSSGPSARAAGDPLAAVVLRAGAVLERSTPSLITVGDLVAWASTSKYVKVTATDDAAALEAASSDLADGADGTVPVDDPLLLLDATMNIPPALGPGQLTAPGKVTPAQHEALLKGAEYGNRVAVLDADPTLDEAGLAAHVAELRTLELDYRGALFDPRAVVPGRAPGVNRTVYWSGIQCGLINRQDLTGNPNRAAAGYFGISRFAGALEREWDDDARERLMHAGVNTARVVYNTVRGYGFRSLVDENGPRRGWLLFSNVRFGMAVKAKADEIAERYVFEVIDGRQKTISRFRGELAGMLMPYWPSALYGATPDDAFRVATDDPVNSDETIAAGEIHAVLLLRMNPFGEWVEIQIVKTPITQALV